MKRPYLLLGLLSPIAAVRAAPSWTIMRGGMAASGHVSDSEQSDEDTEESEFDISSLLSAAGVNSTAFEFSDLNDPSDDDMSAGSFEDALEGVGAHSEPPERDESDDWGFEEEESLAEVLGQGSGDLEDSYGSDILSGLVDSDEVGDASEAIIDVDAWLDSHARDPAPSQAPPLKRLEELSSDEEEESVGEPETGSPGHSKAGNGEGTGGRRVALQQRSNFSDTKAQVLKLAVLYYSGSMLRKGHATHAEYVKGATTFSGAVIFLMTVLHTMIARKVLTAHDQTLVELTTVSPLGALKGKKPSTQTVTVEQSDMANLRAVRLWCLFYLLAGAALSAALGTPQPFFVAATMSLIRYTSEPLFAAHIMGLEADKERYNLQRPFRPPSLFNSILGASYGACANPEEKWRSKQPT